MSDGYSRRIAELHKALGIPADYAFRRKMTAQEEAPEADLVTARILKDGRELRLFSCAAKGWEKMQSSALTEGHTLLLISAHRSVDHQTRILRTKLEAGQSLEAILRVNAAPGYSEHHTGRAVDIGTPGCPPLSEEFEQTAAFAWLCQHANHFGFHLSYPRDNPHGVIYEPWHWLYCTPTTG
jgi:D-alanyl-D-alanine carboxypeptidase